MTFAIETRDLSKQFDRITAVSNLNLQVAQGEVFGLMGPDGAGKTTTMRMLCAIMDPSRGSGKVAGFDILSQSERVKERIGYMSQRFSLYSELSVAENIEFFANLFAVKREEFLPRRKDLLEFSNLTPFADRLAGQLSGGMKQKLALCCTLIHTPEVLFLDEPTTGVDPISRREFWRILNSLTGKVTIFVSTAYLDEAERCNRLALLHEGKLLACDSPDAIKRGAGVKTLEAAFINFMGRENG